MQILSSRQGESLKKTQARLLEIGSIRTVMAIKCRVHKSGLQGIEKESWYHTPIELSETMRVDQRIINTWLKIGILSTNDDGLITDKEVKKMLVNYTAMIDFSVIDKYWLVDVLTGQTGEKAK